MIAFIGPEIMTRIFIICQLVFGEVRSSKLGYVPYDMSAKLVVNFNRTKSIKMSIVDRSYSKGNRTLKVH